MVRSRLRCCRAGARVHDCCQHFGLGRHQHTGTGRRERLAFHQEPTGVTHSHAHPGGERQGSPSIAGAYDILKQCDPYWNRQATKPIPCYYGTSARRRQSPSSATPAPATGRRPTTRSSRHWATGSRCWLHRMHRGARTGDGDLYLEDALKAALLKHVKLP